MTRPSGAEAGPRWTRPCRDPRSILANGAWEDIMGTSKRTHLAAQSTSWTSLAQSSATSPCPTSCATASWRRRAGARHPPCHLASETPESSRRASSQLPGCSSRRFVSSSKLSGETSGFDTPRVRVWARRGFSCGVRVCRRVRGNRRDGLELRGLLASSGGLIII